MRPSLVLPIAPCCFEGLFLSVGGDSARYTALSAGCRTKTDPSNPALQRAKHNTKGTAGLRGKMGPGFSRMNAVTVQQSTQGLCRYLEEASPDLLRSGGVLIGAL